MRRLERLRAAACAIALAIAAPACAPPRAHVAQGEAYSTGNPTYDEFFAAVREVRFQAISAESDERAAHAGLITAFGLEPATPPGALIDEAQVRAKRFKDDGVLLHMELVPDAKLLALKNKEIGADAEGVLKAVETSTKTALELGTRLGAIAARAADLEKKRVDLRAQAPSTFRGEPQARRDEIVFELDAAAAVLASAGETGARHAGSASKFAIDLARAVETGAGSAPPEPPAKQARGPGRKPPAAPPPRPTPIADAKPPAKPPADAKPGKPAGRPAAAPAKPPPAAAAPPPAKKGKPDDFEP